MGDHGREPIQRDEPGSARAPQDGHGGQEAHYARLLDEYGASERSNGECVRFLEEFGFSRGQARNAVFRYRSRRGLVRMKKAPEGNEASTTKPQETRTE